jgi:regulator of sigma E protease
MDILIKTLQVLMALSILILIHELGHFIFSKIFKIRVEKFYLFFDPWFSIFKYKPKKSDTEYGLGWLPLGGYCKISGMIDESLDTETLKKEPQPWEFRSKPAWQRFLVMFGGVFFNFILAIIIYSGVLYVWGEEYLRNSDAVYGIQCNDLAAEIGFRNGDKILLFDEQPVEKFQELQIALARNQAKVATVLRGKDTVTINIDQTYLPVILKNPGMFQLRVPFVISEVPDSSQNVSAGILPGDRIAGINGNEMASIQEIQTAFKASANDSITLNIIREGQMIEKRVFVNDGGKIGVVLESDISKLFKITRSSYSIVSVIPAGFNKTITTVSNYFKELGLIFSPKTEAYKSVGSFITIGKIFPSEWDWQIFWNITAWLSIMLAVLNLLPIPALDGGHILFLIYEIVTGRKPHDKFLEYAQIAGMLILFAIMILAFGNDIYRLFK